MKHAAEQRTLELLLDWAKEEGHPDVLSERSERKTFTSKGLNVLLALVRDPDSSVRQVAGYVLVYSLNPEPAMRDTVADLLDDEDQQTRIWAVYGLAERDDPRTLAPGSKGRKTECSEGGPLSSAMQELGITLPL